MTLFHFGNYFALVYFPYLIMYKCSGLSEYNAFWKCVQAGATYLFVQLCKMLFLATFFPMWEGRAGIYDFIGEFMKATKGLGDLVGLHPGMSQNAGKGEYKVMVAAVGWATAELCQGRDRNVVDQADVGTDAHLDVFPMELDTSALTQRGIQQDMMSSAVRPPLTLLLGISIYKAFIP
ncbi:transmembrane protein 147-like [Dromiciops gliroides]|uniref:transmembrane protein 147-like n=1 Tax=Dromiciops gliroides TaxID=33562 RepID=UPI001CC36169|nr:transmembrane protein 147-like [Dromiciops gliroides]